MVGSNVWGVGIVEVLWKTLGVILYLRLGSSITLQDMMHGFRAGRRMGTASLEAKLLQQLTATWEEVLYAIFLVLHKAYDALSRDRYLGIIDGYWVGP